MIPAYSSGVPVRRLLDAILGASAATWIWAKRPSAVKIRMPFGVSPNGNDFLPSGAVTSATTKFQLPTIWSFRPVAGCAAAVPTGRASASKAAAVILKFIVSPSDFFWRSRHSLPQRNGQPAQIGIGHKPDLTAGQFQHRALLVGQHDRPGTAADREAGTGRAVDTGDIGGTVDVVDPA